jgi:RimJ/RimL family protein N-acetyltransferase
MHLLDETAYEAVRPLLVETIGRHTQVAAILEGLIDGRIWVDDPDLPAIALVSDGEATWLAGDPGRLTQPEALRALIPAWTYFLPDDAWVQMLPIIWDNPFARPHPRLRFALIEAVAAAAPPDGFDVLPVNQQTAADHPAIRELAEDESGRWRSLDAFLDCGVGYVVLHDGAVVSHCLADCVVGNRAELGVGTEAGFRRLGLGRAVAIAAANDCRRRGIVDVGWHCHASNAGSIRIAEAAGFRLQSHYFGYSSNMPAENAGDLSLAALRDWAVHLEAAAATVHWHGFHAAAAWTLAGEPGRALVCLERLVAAGWRGRPEWLEQHWAFAAVRESAAFRAIVARQRG